MAKNPNFPPVKCPVCKKDGNLIIKQPDYSITTDHLSIECACVKCMVRFVAYAEILVKSYSEPEPI